MTLSDWAWKKRLADFLSKTTGDFSRTFWYISFLLWAQILRVNTTLFIFQLQSKFILKEKVERAQAANYSAAIIFNNKDDELIPMGEAIIFNGYNLLKGLSYERKI